MSDLPPPAKQRRADPLEGYRAHEREGVGSFFAQNKALVDARRHHLDRLGMDERHATALRMPTTSDEPVAVVGEPAVKPVEAPRALTGDAPEEPPVELTASYSPKRPPRVDGVAGDLVEDA